MDIIPQVIEKAPAGSMASYDLYSKLLKERVIFMGGNDGEVTTFSSNNLIAQLLYLESEDNTLPINIYVQSPGGSCSAGLALYDCMQYIKAPIHTVCIGMAMSFGAVILAAGTKGHRYSLPESRILIHQPLIYGGGISGQATDISIQSREMEHTRLRLEMILARHTGQPLEKVNKDCERDFYMSAEEAKAYGIIDHIIPYSKTI